MFNFWTNFGAIKSLRVGIINYLVRPSNEKHFELINSSKDASRQKPSRFIQTSQINYQKKKDVNKSDAILIALYYEETQNSQTQNKLIK